MSKLKFFADEHIANAIVDQLRRREIDVLRCVDVGMEASADIKLLEYATENGFALLSMDDDVTRLHTEWVENEKDHGGIFYAPMAQFMGEHGIGPIVRFCSEWSDRIENGMGTLEESIHNRLLFIKKR